MRNSPELETGSARGAIGVCICGRRLGGERECLNRRVTGQLIRQLQLHGTGISFAHLPSKAGLVKPSFTNHGVATFTHHLLPLFQL
jgi:hypothetical protein